MEPITEKPGIIIVDDDEILSSSLKDALKDRYRIDVITECAALNARIDSFRPSVIICNIFVPGGDGIELFREMRQLFPAIKAVVISPSDDVELAVQCMKLGAADFLIKPVDVGRVLGVVESIFIGVQPWSENEKRRPGARRNRIYSTIIGESDPMLRVFDIADRALERDVNVLITGESGTGKELLAKAIHDGSRRSRGPYVAVNCAAITPDLAESLLFGHKKGSFTGAVSDHTGFFEQAHRGTLFLDEIGDLNIDVQARILRVIEDRKVRPLGGSREITVDIRIISATNREFTDEIRNKRFRSDLFYRLDEYPIHLPPLREREDDVHILGRYLLKEVCEFYELGYMTFSNRVEQEMGKYAWPGNVRELKNVIHRAAMQSLDPVITELPLGVSSETIDHHPDDRDLLPEVQDEGVKTLEEVEFETIQKVYSMTGRHPEKTAILLGISRATLYRRLRKYGLIQD